MATLRKWFPGIGSVARVGALTLGLFSCTDEAGRDLGDGTQRMVERLEEIAASQVLLANIYMNAERVGYFRAQVEALRKSAAGETQDSKEILEMRLTLATELLRSGQSEETVRELQKLQKEVGIDNDSRMRHIVQFMLGLSHLRLGEQENCIIQHNIESCLLPIRGKGVHQIERGSRAAIAEFLQVLEQRPRDLSARWLLNIAYMTLGEYPQKVPPNYLFPAKVFESDYDIKRFRDVAPRHGLDVVGLSGGSIMEDFDGDGHLDIMASSWGLRHQVRYFKNSGDGSFAERTAEVGLSGIVSGLNLSHADYDNNGFADVLVLRGAWLEENGHHPNSLLRNEGGKFVDVTEAAGLLTLHPTQTATWGDFNNDGWVDLFVGNESLGEEIHPCELYRNNGNGTFSDVAAAVGVDVVGYVKGVAWGDYDNDGLLDLYISRLLATEPNILLRNAGEDAAGHWHFEDVTAGAGVPGPNYSFPTWFWDYDNDGWQDIFVAGFKGGAADVAADYLGLPHGAETPRLYRNNGDGTFADVTRRTQLDKALISMGSNFGDLDNDGYLDFYIGTGDPSLTSLMPNRMFRNAVGEFFQDVTTSGGFGHLQKGHAVAFGDIDHDGDQDIFAVMGGAYSGDVYANALFENPGHGNHWIKLKLTGVRSNRAAIGARIKVRVQTADGGRNIHATVTSGGSFGASSMQQEIGLGRATAIDAIEVVWPASGAVQVFEDIGMDQMLYIREGDPTPSLREFAAFELYSDGGIVEPDHAHHGPN